MYQVLATIYVRFFYYGITLNATWTVLIQIRLKSVFFCGLYSPSLRFIACIQIQSSYSGRFNFLHLSTLPRPDFPGRNAAKIHYRLVLFWARALQSFYFLKLSFMAHAKLQRFSRTWTPMTKETSEDLTHKIWQDGTFFHYPFFVLNIPFCLFYLLSLIGIMFPLFVSFDIVWQLATTHATGTQIVRAKIASLDAIFCRGNKSSSRSLARFCRRKQKIYRSRLALVKTNELDLYLSLHNGQRRESCGKVVTYGKVYPG